MTTRTPWARRATALLLAGAAATAGATTVTYTFTEFDGDGKTVLYQLRHSLNHFLDAASGETVDFALADIVVDPMAAWGGTLALQQVASADPASFSALPGFITFNGATFCGLRFPQFDPCDPGNQFLAVSYDMGVTDGVAGSWTQGDDRLDVTVTNDGNPHPTPEPGSLALALIAVAAAATAVPRRRRR